MLALFSDARWAASICWREGTGGGCENFGSTLGDEFPGDSARARSENGDVPERGSLRLPEIATSTRGTGNSYATSFDGRPKEDVAATDWGFNDPEDATEASAIAASAAFRMADFGGGIFRWSPLIESFP